MIWNWKGWILALGLLMLAAVWVGCGTPPPPQPYNCIDDEIRIGDTLNISYLDIPPEHQPAEKQFVVRSDGTVNLARIGAIPAANLKFGAFERAVEQAYIKAREFNHITVAVKPGVRFYTVGGEVNGKSRQEYVGQTTVLRAIASCGDFTEYANKRKVVIIRANGDREVMDCVQARKNPKKYDRPICPGDYIDVPRSL